jgi:hypothetical protein
MEGEMRIQMAPLVEMRRSEHDQLGPEDLGDLPVFDLGDQNDWMEYVEGMLRARAREADVEHTRANWSHCFRTTC